MAIKYGFFHSLDGDRKYTAEDIGRYLWGVVSNGVYADEATSLQVLADEGMQVQVQAGRAMLSTHYIENDGPFALALNTGGSQDRVDAIVARMDLVNRLCEIVVKQGTPAASPAAPAMTRSETVTEIMLAAVRVTKLATAITQENITDTRADETVCGWVHGLIEQVPTGALLAQYQQACQAELEQLRKITQEQLAEISSFKAALTEELNVLTYVQEYRNMVTLTEETDTVYIGINDFEAGVDVLFVNYRGLLYMEEDYTVHGTGADAYVVLTEARKAGDPIEFRVLKSQIGSADAAAVFALADDDGTVLTDNGAALTLE